MSVTRPVSAAHVAWAACGLTWTFAVLDVIVLVASGVGLLSAEVLDQGFPIVTLATVISSTIGAAVVARDARNRVGWLLSAGGFGTMTGLLVTDWGRAVVTDRLPGSEQLGHWALWLGNLVSAPYAIAIVGAIFLLVPDGRLQSRRWRFVGAGLAVALILATAAYLLVPPSHVQPDGVDDARLMAQVLDSTGVILLTIFLALSAVALVLRLRRARGIERQQLRWIAASATATAMALVFLVVIAITVAPNEDTPVYASIPLYLGYLSVPVATGFAVLRYRLYDVDIIIGRAVVLGVLAVFVTAGYVAVVLIVSAIVGSPGDERFWLSLLATAVVALAFQPLRRRVQDLADRVVYGERAAPYEALEALNHQLGLSLDVQELLPRVAEVSARSVGAERSRVELLVPDGLPVQVKWPPDGDSTDAYSTVLDVRHGGEVVGTIAVDVGNGRSLAGRDRRLLGDLADQSALALRNAALVAVLRARSAQLARDADDIEASRRRLVVAGQAERARIARSINREVVPHLSDMPDEIDRLGAELSRGAAGSGVLEGIDALQGSTTEALEALRVITRGVFPAALARRGLVAALRAQLNRIPQPATLDVEPELDGLRCSARVEGAAYQCFLEIVTDLDPAIAVSLRRQGDRLALTIKGQERVAGWDERDHVLMSDRLQSVGGAVTTRRSGGQVLVELVVPFAPPDQPVATADQAAASRSGPKADLGT